MHGVVAIVVGALFIALGPARYHWRHDPGAQAGAGAGRRAGRHFGSGRPLTARQIARSALFAVLLGVVLIVYGVATL